VIFLFIRFVYRLSDIKNRRRIKLMPTSQCVARMLASAAVDNGIRWLVQKAMPAIASVLWQTGDFFGSGVLLIRGVDDMTDKEKSSLSSTVTLQQLPVLFYVHGA